MTEQKLGLILIAAGEAGLIVSVGGLLAYFRYLRRPVNRRHLQ